MTWSESPEFHWHSL